EINELLTSTANEENTVLILETITPEIGFWIDDMELIEVEAKITDPAEHFLFEYNYSNNSKEIFLEGNYLDLGNNTFSDKVIIVPYSSILLINNPNSKEQNRPLPPEDPVLTAGYSLSVNLGSKAEVNKDSQPFLGEEAIIK